MKITRKQIQRIIREEILKEQKSRGSVDIMDDVSDREIQDAWPERLEFEGVNVYDAVYQNSGLMNQIYNSLESAGYADPNEVYLGYDFDSNDFIMGFDAFAEEFDEYRDLIHDSEMEGVFVAINTMGEFQSQGVVLTVPGGVYDSIGRSELRRNFPSILDVRLD